MHDPQNELTGTFVSIKKNRRLLLYITIGGTIFGAIFSFATPSKYKASVDVILRNPLYDDRGNLHSSDGRFLDYFAGEDDIDKLILLSKSDIVVLPLIRKMRLAEAYKIDATTRKGSRTLEKRVRSRLNVMRNQYHAVTLTYIDTDPTRAANVANECVRQLENAMSGFYSDMRASAYQSILAKIHEQDSAIELMTDSLAVLRREYEIYDIISPSRHNIMLSTVHGNKKPGFERAIEHVQNIESVKDELVSHRANQITLANQYSTATNKARIPLLKVITPAKNNMSPMLSSPIIVVICMAISFLFGLLLISFKDGMAERSSKKRKNSSYLTKHTQ